MVALEPTPSAMLVLNPTAGPLHRRHQARQLETAARKRIPELSVAYTTAPGHATQLAAQAADDGVPRIYVAGGDGTFNEVLQGVVNTPTGLCPLPLGTASVLCEELLLPRDPLAALERTLKRTARPISVGQASGNGWSRYFLLMAGIGIDGAIIQRLPGPLKARLGVAAYFLTGALTLITYRYPEIRVTCQGRTHTGTSLVVANGANYAAGFKLTPQGSLARPDLAMVMFAGDGPFAYLGHAFGVLTQTHTTRPGVHALTGREFQVEGPPSVAAHLDGEPVGALPMTVTCMANAVHLPLPSGQENPPGIFRSTS